MPPKKEKIEALTLREQVLLRPDTYLGSIQIEKITKEVFSDDIIKPVEFDYNHGLFQIFVEIMSNAVDNVARSRKFGIPPGEIHVVVESKTVTITNWGYSIPIEKHHTLKDKYIAEVALFSLLTSSNYDDSEKRKSSGRNGLGSKLTNIFSKRFQVQIYDTQNGLFYSQRASNNLSIIDPPKVEPVREFPFSVQISYEADFERFGVPDGYTQEFLQLMEKYVIDASAITGVKTIFNGREYQTNFASYVSDYYYTDDELVKIHLPKITPDEETESGFEGELLIVQDDTSTVREVSFVNGVVTDAGGNHIKAVWDALLPELVKRIKTKLKFEANQTHLKKYFRLFFNAELYNPAFGSQSKAKLVSKVPKLTLKPSVFNQIMEWEWVDWYKDFHASQNIKARSKTDGKKVRYVKVEKANDANEAGTRNSQKCTLIITEGDSAKSFASNGRTAIQNGEDYYGVYPIRGKGLNTMNATETQITENKEIANIKTLLGLKTGVDYTLPENRRKLRYGKVLVLSDADDDGLHIRGLTMLIFAELYEPLLQHGFIQFMETPVVRVYKNRNLIQEFYTSTQFEAWRQGKNMSGYEVRHIKGLGSALKPEQLNAFKNIFIVDLEYTPDCKSQIQLVFNKKLADERKKWLSVLEPRPDPVNKITISDFLNKHFKHYSWADNLRSIPALDGLKISQRKCVYASIAEGYNSPHKHSIKIAALASLVVLKTKYDHGDQSLQKAIVLMAQNYPGASNLPLYEADGEFGSRAENGKDASEPRYIFTKLKPYINNILSPLDEPLLKHVVCEGKDVEPYMYYPIICMPLINGVKGIGTGWSTMVWSYNPIDVIKLHREWLDFVEYHRKLKTTAPVITPTNSATTMANNTTTASSTVKGPFTIKKKSSTAKTIAFTPSKILPYFKGYTGRIVDENGKITMYGKYEVKKEYIEITEVPLKFSLNKYKTHLENWVEQGCIKEFKKYGDDDTAHYQLYGYNEEKFGGPPSYETLLLSETLSHENISLLDETHSHILTFDNIYELLCHYSKIRLKKYEERRQIRITHLKNQFPLLQLKYKFVIEVMEGTLEIHHRDEVEIYKDMDERRYPHDFLGMPIRSFTKQKLAEIQNEMQKIQDELEYLFKTLDIEMWRVELTELENVLNSIKPDDLVNKTVNKSVVKPKRKITKKA